MDVEAQEEMLLAEPLEALPPPQQEVELNKSQRKNRRARLRRRLRLQQVAASAAPGLVAAELPGHSAGGAFPVAAAPAAAVAALPTAVPAAAVSVAAPVQVSGIQAVPRRPCTASAVRDRRPLLPQAARRPNQARHVPRSVFNTAWEEMRKAKRSLDVAMELLKFYRYDG